MVAVLALALSLSQAPPGNSPAGPGAFETAKLFFLAGDISKAQDIARSGLKTDKKRCTEILKLLAEYAFLANHMDEFTPGQAKAFLELDAKIAPGGVGKLTRKTIERFIEKPLEVAKLRAQAGDPAGAAAIAREALKVDPKHAGTLAFLASLEAADAGARDAGR
ncbi:MAG: hypothetical protein AB1730_24155 [Myxococcota bacterium]|jgi:hypothetical protein